MSQVFYTVFIRAWTALLSCLIASVGMAQSPPSEQRARTLYNAARGEHESAPSNARAAWHLGRAAYDLAELVRDSHQRQEIAQAGVDACRKAIATDPQSAAAHYYLALNIGELAQTKKLGALRLLHEMERELLKAAEIDPAFDYGGPDRSLGMLYLEAPSWPASVGNRNKARAHLETAVQLSPDYPENHIALAEAYADWGEARNLEHELQLIDQQLSAAKTRFAGEIWAPTWKDWTTRLEKLRKSRERLLSNPRLSPSERGAKPVR